MYNNSTLSLSLLSPPLQYKVYTILHFQTNSQLQFIPFAHNSISLHPSLSSHFTVPLSSSSLSLSLILSHPCYSHMKKHHSKGSSTFRGSTLGKGLRTVEREILQSSSSLSLTHSLSISLSLSVSSGCYQPGDNFFILNVLIEIPDSFTLS